MIREWEKPKIGKHCTMLADLFALYGSRRCVLYERCCIPEAILWYRLSHRCVYW